MPAKKNKGRAQEEKSTTPASIVEDPDLPGRLINDQLKMLLPVAKKIEEMVKSIKMKAPVTKLGRWIADHLKDIPLGMSLRSMGSCALLLAAIASQMDDDTEPWDKFPDESGIDLMNEVIKLFPSAIADDEHGEEDGDAMMVKLVQDVANIKTAFSQMGATGFNYGQRPEMQSVIGGDPPPPRPPPKFCYDCGHARIQGSKFCASCGCQFQAPGEVVAANARKMHINDSLTTTPVKPLCLNSRELIYVPLQWHTLLDDTDHGQSLCLFEESLKKSCFTVNKALNHHAEILVELATFLLNGDVDEALVLISDRLQFLQMLGSQKPLPICMKFYRALRGEHMPQRIKNAQLEAQFTSPADKQRAHVLNQLKGDGGGDADAGGNGFQQDNAGTGNGRGGGGRHRRGKHF